MPFFDADPCLPQDAAQEIDTGIAPVGIRYDHSPVTALHELVVTADEGAFKAQLPQPADDFPTRNGS